MITRFPLGFKAVELQVVKPRVKSIDGGNAINPTSFPNDPMVASTGQESAEACRARIESSGGVQDLHDFFNTIDTLRSQEGPYLLGVNPTWPDFFLYPLVSDLLATPDADLTPPR